jgi:hypothetical protein
VREREFLLVVHVLRKIAKMATKMEKEYAGGGTEEQAEMSSFQPPKQFSKTVPLKTCGEEEAPPVRIEYPLELRCEDYLRRILLYMRPALTKLYAAVMKEGDVDGMTQADKYHRPALIDYVRHMGQTDAHLEAYADVVDRLPAFIGEHYTWMLEACHAIEHGYLHSEYESFWGPDKAVSKEGAEDDTVVSAEDGLGQDMEHKIPQRITENTVRSAFGNSVAFVHVLGEHDDVKWVASNINDLRAQFVAHVAYKRERLPALLEGPTALSARGDRPTLNPDGSLTFTYRHDFDKNGILYYIGTQGLTAEWENPAITKQVEVAALSMGSGDITNFVGRDAVYTCTDYREPNQWLQVDMGQFRRVYPTRYTLRHGSGYGWLRVQNWRCEGSMDGKRWFTLRRHTNDDSLPSNEPFGTCSFDIEEKMCRKTRFFRIVQTKPNRGQENLEQGKFKHNTLFLCGFEVYGRLVEK